MGWFGSLKQAAAQVDKAMTRANVRTYYGSLTAKESEDGASGGTVGGEKFLPERSYFSVRVVEMRLAEAGRYFTEFVPMCSCFLRYGYGRSQRNVPFVLGSETLSTGLGKNIPPTSGQRVQFRNVYIVRNVPMKADNLMMYAALCRFADSGFARGLVDLLSDAAGAVGGPAVGAVAHTAVNLTTRLGSLLGAKGVETRFGMLNGSALDFSGYRILAGVPSIEFDGEDLAMQNGQLVRRASDGSAMTIDDVDYLIVSLEHRTTLVDESFGQIAILPFHARWEEVRSKLLQEDVDGAKQAFRRLLVEVAESPDVTEGDRSALIASYRSAFDQWSGGGGRAGGLLAGRASEDLRVRLSRAVGRSKASDVAAVLESTRVSLTSSEIKAERISKKALQESESSLALLGQRATAVANAVFSQVPVERSEQVFGASSAALLSLALQLNE
jgi:hypothetical protein